MAFTNVSQRALPRVFSEVWVYFVRDFLSPRTYFFPDIKKAITCLLFGGSKKILPDGMRLRGDINVLLLGDPGTAKSQLLKFVEKVRSVSPCVLVV
jgi:DNA replicative helicase MCM subunit Mcm2 (Cdc46/Mcm family)